MNVLNEEPLKVGEFVDLNRIYQAGFNGAVVRVVDPRGETVLEITPVMMAHLFWLNRRIQRTFPDAFCVDLSELDE